MSNKNGNALSRRVNAVKDDFLFPIQKEFDKFFGEFFGDQSIFDSVKNSSGYPKMDHTVENGQWVMRAAIPGVKPEDVKIEIPEEGLVRISGQMAEEYQSPEGSEMFVRELRKGKFLREFRVPDCVVGEPDAIMKDGMLVLKWNMEQKEKENVTKTKVIEVKAE